MCTTVTGIRVDNLSFARIAFVRFSEMNFLIQKSTNSLICAYEKKNIQFDDKWSSCDWSKQWINNQVEKNASNEYIEIGIHVWNPVENRFDNVSYWNELEWESKCRKNTFADKSIRKTVNQFIIDRSIDAIHILMWKLFVFVLFFDTTMCFNPWIASFVRPPIFGLVDCATKLRNLYR